MIDPASLTALFSIGSKLIDRWFPDEESKAKAQLDLMQYSKSVELQQDKDFRDFVTAYEGRGDVVHPAIQILRGSVRPVITYVLAGFFLYGFINPTEVDAATMDLLWKLNLISLSFWFGERALRNLGLDLGKKEVK